MGDKFGWEKANRKARGNRAARAGLAFYCGAKKKPRPQKKKKSARKQMKTETWNAMLPMPFGKHKGIPLAEVPIDYLRWVLREVKDLRPFLRRSINVVVNSGYSRTKLRKQKPSTATKEVRGEYYIEHGSSEVPF